jgi:hypothetical protein
VLRFVENGMSAMILIHHKHEVDITSSPFSEPIFWLVCLSTVWWLF